jgi:hypothetical protein
MPKRKKGRGFPRPKSREETPKEGSGSAGATAPQKDTPQCTKCKGGFDVPATLIPKSLWMNRKRAACVSKRPKSREETPKEGDGNAEALPHRNVMAVLSQKCK